MKNYFANCQTLDEAKALYKKLAFQLHPDMGGDTAEFQEMQNQFEKFRPQREKYTGEFEQHNAHQFQEIINDLIKIKGIIIEICGSFIWLSGDTRNAKEQIKAIKNEMFKPAQWHKKKLMWFFAPIDYKKFSSKEYDMDDIRNKYGSQTFNATKDNEIMRKP